MIFASVGTQLPFPRLIEALHCVVDALEVDIFAQTIESAYTYTSKGRLRCVMSLSPSEYDAHAASASILIAHAGIGSIITAARHQKPIILFPRRSHLGEHRNDHQSETIRRFGDEPGIHAATSWQELVTLVSSELLPRPPLTEANSSLVSGIKDFIWNQAP